MSEHAWLNVRETAKRLGKSEEQIRRYARARGHLPFTRVGRTYRFEVADITAYLARKVEPVVA